jgi:hypothetical protein
MRRFATGTLAFALLIGCRATADWPDLRGRDVARQQALAPKLALIRREHPRIYCTEPEIEAIKQRCATDPVTREVWSWVEPWARGDHYYRNLWATPTQLQGCVIAYRLTDRDPAILKHALAIADYLAQAQGDGWTWPRISKALAMAYDWLYDDLTPEQKQRYGRGAINAAQQCYKTWRHSEFNNHLYLEYGPVLYAGIALQNEGIDDAAARQLALDGLDLLLNHMLPAHELVTQGQGGWHESMSYHAFFTCEFGQLVELWSSASGDDPWETFSGLDNEAAWLVYCARPWDNGRVAMADIGDYDSYDGQITDYMPLLALRKRDGVAAWWGEQIRQESARRHAAGKQYILGDGKWWEYLLWHDPSVAPVPRDTLPLSRHFGGIGWVSMRSSWQPDATFALFTCAPLWLGGHQHCDNNSFVIGKGGWLALDSGVYDAETNHRGRYYARTIAHNTITVTDPAEQFAGGTWGYGAPGQGPNDGGQLYTTGPDFVTDVQPDDQYHRGRIVTYEATDQYVFVVGDATRSYSPSKLREFTRAFLFVPPNCFIIGDLVRVAPNADRVRWLLHSATQPKVDGDRVEIIGDGGRLVMQTVVPFAPGRDVTVVGGPGHEFEVNGINYAPGKKYDPAEAGQWRLELAPKAPDTQYRFLNVLATSEAGSTAWPEVVHQSDPAGATLVVRLAGREVAVRLAGESPLFSHLTIRDTRTNEALCDADLGEG